MTVVGIAEILVVAQTSAFRKQLEEDTSPAFAGLKSDAKTAGEDAGAGLRTGVKDGSKGLENDLAELGSAGGINLRRGVTEETGKLAEDVGKDGEKAGESLHKGMSGGLSKLANLIENTGLPLGGLSTGLEKAGDAAKDADSKSSGLAGTLDKVGGVALAGVAGGLAVTAAAAVDVGEKMNAAETAIAQSSGTSVAAAQKIGGAFLDTAFKSRFSAVELSTAFAGVAGELKAMQGHALDSKQALQVMSAAGDLAEGTGTDLTTTTATLAGVMQAFQLKTDDAAHASDVLFSASTQTGVAVGTLAAQVEKVRAKLGDTAGSLGDMTGLLVDMTHQGITGRAAMSGLTSGLNALDKTATGVTAATTDQKAAYDQMPPSLQKLADAYRSGSMTSSDFTKATEGLAPAQAALVASFTKATTAVSTAQLKFKEMGVTAFDASGKFVGMGSVIDQLHPKFALMNQDQQLAAATALFGAGAARQLTAVIDAGPAAYDKATSSVNKLGTAHAAAEKYAESLKGEEETLESGLVDLAGKIGALLIPILTALVGAFVKATQFATQHQAVLIALAAVVTGVLGTAIAVFTVNKMAAFGQSFSTAAGHVTSFASGVKDAVTKVIGMFTAQTAAAEEASGAIQTNAEKSSSAVETNAAKSASATSTAAGEMEADNTAAGGSFTAMAAEAGTASAGIDTTAGATAGAVSTADSTIEGENATAGGSFTAMATEAGTASAGVDTAVGVEAGAVGTADAAIEGENATAALSFGGVLGALSKVAGLAAAGFAGYEVAKSIASGGAAGQPGGKPTTQQKQAGLPGTVVGPSAATPTPSSGLSASQSSIAQQIIAEGRKLGAPQSAITGALDAAFGESSFNPGASNSGHTGVFQSTTGESTAAQIQGWYTGGASFQGGGGIAQAKAGKSPGAIATTVEAGGRPASYYGQYTGRSQGILASYGAKERTSMRDSGTQPIPLPSTGAAEKAAAAAVVAAQRQAATAEQQAVLAGAQAQTGAVKGASIQQIAAAKDAATEQKSEAKRQTADVGAGTTQLNRMLTAIHSGSLASLKTALSTAHTTAMSATEKALDKDHSTALATLSKELVAVHERAMDKLVADEAAAAKAKAATAATAAAAAATAAAAAAAAATATAATQANTLLSDQAKQTADQIANASKVYLDQQAQAGLSGAALVAAQAQTAMDQTTQSSDAAIDAAQVGVDMAASQGVQVQQEAAAGLAQAQAAATVQNATAQAALDQANAAATAAAAAASASAASTASTTTDTTAAAAATPTAAAAVAPVVNLNIYGNGQMSLSQLMTEIGFAITTGALPVAPPPPIPAVA